jgi:hypothetical protein
MDGYALAEATAAKFGENALAATNDILAGRRTRSFGLGLNEYVAIGSFIASMAQVAIGVYQTKTSSKEFLDVLAQHEQASGSLNPELRAEIAKQMFDVLSAHAQAARSKSVGH